jgi:hypothetical protein|tara:strand:+ start:105 stop:731 length:627 start_codon:yes stop_codon:yes gene_type:complete
VSIVTYNNRSIANISAIPGAAKSLTHIKTLTASSSSTLSFVNGSDNVVLDSTYPIYIFKFFSIHPSGSNPAFQFNMSIDGGSNYNVTKTSTFIVSYHLESTGANTLGYDTGFDLAQSTNFQSINPKIGGGSDECGSGTLTIFNPSSTTFVKHFISSGATHSYSSFPASYRNQVAGYGNTTSAVNAIRFQMDSGNIDAGTIKLYGLKDS